MPIRLTSLPTAAIFTAASLAALTACSSSGGDTSAPPVAPPKAATLTGTVGQNTSGSKDVTVDSCSVDAVTKIPNAALTVTNHGTETATYLVQLEFLDGSGTRLAEGPAIAHSVAAGGTAKETAGGTAQVTTNVTCELAKVQRLAGM